MVFVCTLSAPAFAGALFFMAEIGQETDLSFRSVREADVLPILYSLFPIPC